MKSFYWVEDDEHNGIMVKADNMKKAVEKYVGKNTFEKLELITDTKDYITYLMIYPKNEMLPETRRLIKARTIVFFT